MLTRDQAKRAYSGQAPLPDAQPTPTPSPLDPGAPGTLDPGQNPVIKQFNGKDYQWNPVTNRWEPVNLYDPNQQQIPTVPDGSTILNENTVIGPDGTNYNIPPEQGDPNGFDPDNVIPPSKSFPFYRYGYTDASGISHVRPLTQSELNQLKTSGLLPGGVPGTGGGGATPYGSSQGYLDAKMAAEQQQNAIDNAMKFQELLNSQKMADFQMGPQFNETQMNNVEGRRMDDASIEQNRINSGQNFAQFLRSYQNDLNAQEKDPFSFGQYLAHLSSLPAGSSSPLQSLIGEGQSIKPQLGDVYSDPRFQKLLSSQYDHASPPPISQVGAVRNAYEPLLGGNPDAARIFFSQKPEDLTRMFGPAPKPYGGLTGDFAEQTKNATPEQIAALHQLANAPAHATGGSQMLTGPVVGIPESQLQAGQTPQFLAGEAGDERLTFTPMHHHPSAGLQMPHEHLGGGDAHEHDGQMIRFANGGYLNYTLPKAPQSTVTSPNPYGHEMAGLTGLIGSGTYNPTPSGQAAHDAGIDYAQRLRTGDFSGLQRLHSSGSSPNTNGMLATGSPAPARSIPGSDPFTPTAPPLASTGPINAPSAPRAPARTIPGSTSWNPQQPSGMGIGDPTAPNAARGGWTPTAGSNIDHQNPLAPAPDRVGTNGQPFVPGQLASGVTKTPTGGTSTPAPYVPHPLIPPSGIGGPTALQASSAAGLHNATGQLTPAQGTAVALGKALRPLGYVSPEALAYLDAGQAPPPAFLANVWEKLPPSLKLMLQSVVTQFGNRTDDYGAGMANYGINGWQGRFA